VILKMIGNSAQWFRRQRQTPVFGSERSAFKSPPCRGSASASLPVRAERARPSLLPWVTYTWRAPESRNRLRSRPFFQSAQNYVIAEGGKAALVAAPPPGAT